MGCLNRYQKQILYKNGFLPSEIHQFDTATYVDGSLQNLNFNAANFQAMIKSRRDWINLVRTNGIYSTGEVKQRISMYYQRKRSKRSVFNLLLIESSPSAKTKQPSDLEMLRKRTMRLRVSRNFGRSYGNPIRPVKLPRNIPKPPANPAKL